MRIHREHGAIALVFRSCRLQIRIVVVAVSFIGIVKSVDLRVESDVHGQLGIFAHNRIDDHLLSSRQNRRRAGSQYDLFGCLRIGVRRAAQRVMRSTFEASLPFNLRYEALSCFLAALFLIRLLLLALLPLILGLLRLRYRLFFDLNAREIVFIVVVVGEIDALFAL